MIELGSSPSDADDSIDLAAALRVLWANRRLVTALTALGAALAVFFAVTAPLVYRAQVVVTLANTSGMSAAASLASQFGGLASLAGINLGGDGANQDAQATLESRRLVEEFIVRNKLLPELSRNPKKIMTIWMAVEKFKKGIVSIREDKRSGRTTIAISWSDPNMAAKWANDFVALANEIIRARALSDATRNIAYLNDQISRTKVVELQQVMYNLIENESKTLMLANARTEYAFAVVDPAVAPEIRVSPKRTVIVLFGVLVGFALGCLLAAAKSFYARHKSSVQRQP